MATELKPTNDLRGLRTLAIPGPTNIPDRIRRAMDIPSEDHRAPDFGDFLVPLLADVKKIFRTETGQVLLFPGSGTGGWEAAIANTLSRGDKVLTATFGQFSGLWADMCTRFGLETVNVDVEWGRGAPVDEWRRILEADTAHEIKAVLLCHNETATGVMSPVPEVRALLDDLGHPALLFVDGVSSIGALDFRMDEWRVDIAVCGSQKAFMLPAGLAIVGISQKAIDHSAQADLPRCYFDFATMLKANATGYFPHTPPTQLLRGLRVSVDMLLDEGLEQIAARHNRLATGVRHAVNAWGNGLRISCQDARWHSDTVTAIRVGDGCDANAIIRTAYDDFGLSLGGGLGAVAGKVFRIGHIGWLNELMVLQFLGGVELTMRSLDMQYGSGVEAAIDYFAGKTGVADTADTPHIAA